MSVSRTQLKSELSQRFRIASVVEISNARKELNHEEPDSVEMSDVEANAVCQWFEQNGDRLETANADRKKKNRKVRTDNEANKDAIIASAQSRHSALLNAASKTAISEADDFEETRQLTFIKRMEQHNNRSAKILEQQLTGLCSYVSQTTQAPEIEELPEAEGNYLEGKETMNLLPAAGIGFDF